MTIKTWLERMPDVIPKGHTATHIQVACMQDEIDELRAEVERLTGSELGLNRYLASVQSESKTLRAGLEQQKKLVVDFTNALQKTILERDVALDDIRELKRERDKLQAKVYELLNENEAIHTEIGELKESGAKP